MALPASPLAANEEGVTTRSAIVIRNVTGHHLLEIEGYSRIKELLPKGKYIDSHSFRIGGCLWHIRYYPNDNSQENSAGFVSIFLFLDEGGGTNHVKAHVTYNLLDESGEPVSWHTRNNLLEYHDKGSMGYSQFISREILENSGLLKDDRLTIKCSITMERPCAEERTVVSPSVDVPPSDLHRHLGNLLITKEGADVTFQVAGETFRAHRYILASRSPVFRAELFGPMRESDASVTVEILDMEAQVFRALLQFMYTDTLPLMTREEETVICQHLLVAADRYNMDRLKLMCEDRLCRSIDVGSVANTLALAEQYCCHDLRKTCMRFLECPEARKAVLTMQTDDFEALCQNFPSVHKELFFHKLSK